MEVKEIAYLAVAVSLFSLLVSGTVFFRTSSVDETAINQLQQVSERTRQEMIDANQKMRQEIALTQARIRLTALRTQIAAEQLYGDAADEVGSIRRSLKRSYAGAAEASYETYVTVDADLETLENQLRQGSADSIDSLETSIGDIGEYIEPNPKTQCVEAGGTWKQFPNTCVDSCNLARNPGVVCGQALTEGCECGQNMCWNGYTCEPK